MNKRRGRTGERAYDRSPYVLALNMGVNRYISEPHESDHSNASTEAEAAPKEATVPEHSTSLPQDMRFARSWIDKDYTNELLDPKVCLRSYRKFTVTSLRCRFEMALRWEKATVLFHFSVWGPCVSRVGKGSGGTLLALGSPQWRYLSAQSSVVSLTPSDTLTASPSTRDNASTWRCQYK
jgi:hypothetical protein